MDSEGSPVTIEGCVDATNVGIKQELMDAQTQENVFEHPMRLN